ncbi:MAG: hypothetical protein QM756_42895 [Polyangiaceae bacterium]
MGGPRVGFLPSLFALGVLHVGACSVDREGHSADTGGTAGKGSGGASALSGGKAATGGSTTSNGGATTVGGDSSGGSAGASAQGGSDVGEGGAGAGGSTEPAGGAGGSDGGATTGGAAAGGKSNGGASSGGASSGGASSGGAGSGGASSGGACGSGCRNGGTCSASGTCTCVAGWVGSTCADPVFQGLGVLPTGTESRGLAISSDGTTVVGDSMVSARSRAFHWKAASGMKALPSPSDGLTYESSTARAVSANGLVVVGTAYPSGDLYRGIKWEAGLVSNVYQGQTASGATSAASLQSVNQDGTVVGGSEGRDADGSRAVRWTNQSRANLLAASYFESYAQGMTPDGALVVGYTAEPSAAFLWSASSGAVQLPYLGTTDWAGAFAVNATGTVIVGTAGDVAVRWVNGAAPVSLGISGAAQAVSADGSVIVGSTTQSVPFVWKGSVALLSETLTAAGANLTGWTLKDANGISADGKVIVGTGVYNGANQAFIARLP